MRKGNFSMKTAITTKTIALAGQPNTGKSTLFNCLTGAHQHVGNWPGKTVEQKSGAYSYKGEKYTLVDLPGTYSLTAGSLEEIISRDFIIKEKPDVVVVMADASQLERSLYLLAEVMLLQVPVILALNMMDVASDQGKTIDVKGLAKILAVPVVPMTATKEKGKEELLNAIKDETEKKNPNPFTFDIFDKDPVYIKVKQVITGKLDEGAREEWIAVKLIEKDNEAVSHAGEKLNESDFTKLKAVLEEIKNGSLYIAGIRYRYISEVLGKTVKRDDIRDGKSFGRKFDRAATHPVLGKIIAVLILVFGFAASMMVVIPVMLTIKPAVVNLIAVLDRVFTGNWQLFGSLIGDGLIPGVTVSLMMLSYIVGVYFVFAFLEDIGYVSRLAYLFDGPMNCVGLHGKSFMPLLLSCGCNIAGVAGTRVIDSWKQKMVTMVMAPIFPCMALWAVVSFLGTIFFGPAMPLVVFSLLAVMVLHLTLTSFTLRKFVAPGETTGLIMELPPYHRPNWKTIFTHVRVQAKSFLKRACTLITVISVAVWALSYRADGNMELSVLASIGNFFGPVTDFIGLDWRLFVALLAAMIAKEASLSVIAVLYGIGNGAQSITSFLLSKPGVGHEALSWAMTQEVSPASALAFIFAFFFSIPCIGTVASIYSETKSMKWTIGSSLYYLSGSLIMGGLAYRAGLLIF